VNMPRGKNWTTITVKKDTRDSLVNLAKSRGISVDALLKKMIDMLKVTSELSISEQTKREVHMGTIPTKICLHKVAHLSEPGRNYCSLHNDYKSDEECSKCDLFVPK